MEVACIGLIPTILFCLFLSTSAAADAAVHERDSLATASVISSDTLHQNHRNTRQMSGVLLTPGGSGRGVFFRTRKLLRDFTLSRADQPRHLGNAEPNNETLFSVLGVDEAKYPTALGSLLAESSKNKSEPERAKNNEAESNLPYFLLRTNKNAASARKDLSIFPNNSDTDVPSMFPLSSDTVPKQQWDRIRRGAFPILPDNHSERQSFFSPLETCRQKEIVNILRPRGCVARLIHSSACEGTCHSRSVPQWDVDRQELRRVTYCTCCKPHQLSYKRIRFRCAGGEQSQPVFYLGVATQCACRPCSDADPRLQQPYDY